jgi:hypothetical protein
LATCDRHNEGNAPRAAAPSLNLAAMPGTCGQLWSRRRDPVAI